MIEFNKTDNNVVMIFTLTENVTVNDPIYDFVFTHILTKSQVTFSKQVTDDESQFQDRYNQFTVLTSLFPYVGQYNYEVTEQQTGINLEKGKLLITEDFNYTIYNGSTNYKVYKG